MEQVELRREFAVVALLSLLKAQQMRLEIFLICPGCAVHALQHLVLRVAAPIGARQLHQLEGLRQLARAGQVRAAAKVKPVALLVDRDRFARRDDVVDDPRLVVFADLLERLDGLVLVPDLADDGIVGINNRPHLGFDLFEILRRERLFAGKIVIEAIIDDWANRDLRVGIQLLHRLGEHMGRIMADQFEAFGIIRRNEFDLRVAVERAHQISQLAINPGGERLLGKGIGNRFCDVKGRRALFIFADGAVWQGYFDHGLIFSCILALCTARQIRFRSGPLSGVCLTRLHQISHPIRFSRAVAGFSDLIRASFGLCMGT